MSALIRTIFLCTTLLFSGLALAAGAVNINTADAAALQTLEGVGPAKAQAIIEYRQANGPFKTADDLGKVSGIGDKTLEANRERISVSGASAEPAKKKPTAKN